MTTLESRLSELSLDVQELKGVLDTARRPKVSITHPAILLITDFLI